jgi:hypothetical protein
MFHASSWSCHRKAGPFGDCGELNKREGQPRHDGGARVLCLCGRHLLLTPGSPGPCLERVDFMAMWRCRRTSAPSGNSAAAILWRSQRCSCKCSSCAKRPRCLKGDVALDGTRIKANASKHKAMSYERMSSERPSCKPRSMAGSRRRTPPRTRHSGRPSAATRCRIGSPTSKAA